MNAVPVVEMLWESADPDRALTGRFGFRDADAAAVWVSRVLERNWALDVDDPAQVREAGQMLTRLHRVLASCPSDRGRRGRSGERQLVHNDFRTANVLHDGRSITAVLDFEDLTWDTRAADLAKAAVLLATKYRDWAPTSEHMRAAFVHAYEDGAEAPLGPAERREYEQRVERILKSFGWA